MSDTIDDYKALAEMRKQERAERRAAAEAKLQGLNYSVHNEGAHIVIWEGGAIFDFWPGTDRWRMRDHKGQFGVHKLLAAIRERKIVAMDLSKIEERVIAQLVDAGKLVSEPFSGDPSTLRTLKSLEVYNMQSVPRGSRVNKTVGALFKGTPTGRIVTDSPPWQELPVTPEEDEAFAAMMEKAYPHLSGPDEKP